ncbi:MAG: ATPase [bacterium]|nr:ATPase [bacterium]
MGASRIEQLIEDIYDYVEGCKNAPLSSTKVIVPKDELYDLLDELRLRTPDEIKRYQKIINNRDAIISDAEVKAATMLAEAQEKTNNLISEHEIMQQAYAQANQIVEEAQAQANQILASANNDAEAIRTGSLSYSDDMLGVVESILSTALEESKTRFTTLLSSMEENLNIVKANKKELTDQLYGSEEEAAITEDTQTQEEAESFEFDNNAPSEEEEQN